MFVAIIFCVFAADLCCECCFGDFTLFCFDCDFGVCCFWVFGLFRALSVLVFGWVITLLVLLCLLVCVLRMFVWATFGFGVLQFVCVWCFGVGVCGFDSCYFGCLDYFECFVVLVAFDFFCLLGAGV